MRTTRYVALVALVLLLSGASAAWAVDMCLSDDYASTLVGKGYTFPTAGNCKPFDGYVLGNGAGCLISGSSCTASDSGLVKFNLQYMCSNGSHGVYYFGISRLYSNIDQAGFGYACEPDQNCTQFHIKQIACPNPHALPSVP